VFHPRVSPQPATPAVVPVVDVSVAVGEADVDDDAGGVPRALGVEAVGGACDPVAGVLVSHAVTMAAPATTSTIMILRSI
jgi:hypothetical protein